MRLVALWQERVGRGTRRVRLGMLLAVLVLAAHWARLGTTSARLGAGAALLLVLLWILTWRFLERRFLSSPEAVIRRVLGPANPALAGQALRARRLVSRTEAPGGVGSVELARLHLSRVLHRVSLEAVTRAAQQRASRFGWVALGLVAIGVVGISIGPFRIVEGLDVLPARRGVAPMALRLVYGVRVLVTPPSHLKRSEYVLFPSVHREAPEGSVITVRAEALRPGRHLVLTDGEREVDFVEDGAGGQIARWTLERDAALRVAARFGQVLIVEPDAIELGALPDEAPRVTLEDAPRTVELKELDRLELRYLAEDDHGLKEIDLVLRSGGREERRVLLRLDGDSRLERGAHALERGDAFLERMFLPVVVSIEARDNDASDGAKWGKSAAITVVPPEIGEPEAARHAAFKDSLAWVVDLLDHQLEDERAERGGLSAEARHARRLETQAARDEGVRALRAAVFGEHAGAHLPPKLSAFALGQIQLLEKTPLSRERTEDVLLALDAGRRSVVRIDAEEVAKRLGDVAEEVASGAAEALDPERRTRGLGRADAALEVLEAGTRHLTSLGDLGADVGSVASGQIERIRRAEAAGRLLHVELAARHLAARLRRPTPSFSSAGGGGGVESGPGRGNEPGEPSEADRQFRQMMGELERLAREHAGAIRGVEETLAGAAEGVAEDLREQAKERAQALRRRLDELPRDGRPGSARASAALGREHMAAMAQNLERLSLEAAVESGRSGRGALSEAEGLSRDRGVADSLDRDALGGAREEIGEQLAWAERVLREMRHKADARAAGDLAQAGTHEEEMARRAGNLAGRGAHTEARLPDELKQALERAEGMMQQAAERLSGGHGEAGLELQREAQRLLEHASSPENGGGSGSEDAAEGGSQQRGRMATHGDVPDRGDASGADAFRKRVLEGLSGERRGRLGPAVERYAEGLLQ